MDTRGVPKEGAKIWSLLRSGATPKDNENKDSDNSLESFPLTCKWGATHIPPHSWGLQPDGCQAKLSGHKMRQTRGK